MLYTKNSMNGNENIRYELRLLLFTYNDEIYTGTRHLNSIEINMVFPKY